MSGEYNLNRKAYRDGLSVLRVLAENAGGCSIQKAMMDPMIVFNLAESAIKKMEEAAKPPAAVQAGDVREGVKAVLAWAYQDDEPHLAKAFHGRITEEAITRILAITSAQPPALTALVEAARDFLDARHHFSDCMTSIENPSGRCVCGRNQLAAALTPYLDPAQPKQEAYIFFPPIQESCAECGRYPLHAMTCSRSYVNKPKTPEER